MSMVGDQVLQDFYGRLEENKDVDAETLKGLRELLGANGKPKVDDLVAVFQSFKEEELP